MRKEEFFKRLEYLLQDMPEQDKEEALQYYRDYLEEAFRSGRRRSQRGIRKPGAGGSHYPGGSHGKSGGRRFFSREQDTKMSGSVHPD